MNADEVALHGRLDSALARCEAECFPLPGAQHPQRREVYLRQTIDSIRRVQYIGVVASRPIHPDRADGLSPMFDPVRAAVSQHRSGNFDEACWLVFLFVHFGKHLQSGYRYARDVYSALGHRSPWTYAAVAADIAGLRLWLDANEAHLRRGNGRGFGNHRKYQSLSGTRANGTGDAFSTYCHWVRAHGDHRGLFDRALHEANQSPEGAFDWLYRSMASVATFGRIGRFDYLTMLQKLQFVAIRPGTPYLESSSSGPNAGARLLLESTLRLPISELNRRVAVVGSYLGVGMQEMEDSLCNWQKSPMNYRLFSG